MLEKLPNCNVSLEKGNFCQNTAALSYVMGKPQNNRIIKNKLTKCMKYKINNHFFSSPASKDSYGHVASIVCMSKHALLTATQATKGKPQKKRQPVK